MLKVKISRLVENGKKIYNTANIAIKDLYSLDTLIKQNEKIQKIEQALLESANQRQDVQKKLFNVQEKIRENRNLLNETPRMSDNYMNLFKNEHNLIKKEHEYINILKLEEEKERQLLSIFSDNIRKTHQIDVVRQSQLKLLSLIFSIFAGIFGFVLNSYLNQYKNSFFNEKIEEIQYLHQLNLEQMNVTQEKLDKLINEIHQQKLDIENQKESDGIMHQVKYYLSNIFYFKKYIGL